MKFGDFFSFFVSPSSYALTAIAAAALLVPILLTLSSPSFALSVSMLIPAS